MHFERRCPLLFNTIDLLCWVVCFFWMFRISARQDRVLKAISEQGRRIERMSKAEHDLIKEVHPVVGEIKERVEEMAVAVSESGGGPQARQTIGESGHGD